MKLKFPLLVILLTLSYTASASSKLMIFGDDNHNVYLGCLNCSDIASDSVHNDVGKFGSDVSSTSIFNNIGKFGSDISQYSPCNTIAQKPPAIVDEQGNFYGYLTLNDILGNATTDSKIKNWLKYNVCKTK